MGRGPTKEYYHLMNENYIEGTLTCLKPSVIKEKINTEFPLVLNIEPTNACNANCYYCPRDVNEKIIGTHFLDINSYRRIIDQILPHKLIMLTFHKDGEPLLHKKLPQMVEYAREKDVAQTIHLNTNGILINSETGRGIIKRGIDDITISIDAACEETYYRLKKKRRLIQLEKNIKSVLNYREQIGSKTYIRVKMMEFGDIKKEEIELFREKWTGIADEVQITGIHNWSGSVDVDITDEKTSKRYPCALLWYMIAVNSNGKVSICNVDWNHSGIIGDLHQKSIREIWSGKLLKKIRKKHLEGVWNNPEICEECVVWVSVGNMWDYLSKRHEFI